MGKDKKYAGYLFLAQLVSPFASAASVQPQAITQQRFDPEESYRSVQKQAVLARRLQHMPRKVCQQPNYFRGNRCEAR